MRHALFIVTALGALAAAGVAGASAQSGPKHPRVDRLERIDELAKLTDDQRAELQAIHDKLRDALGPRPPGPPPALHEALSADVVDVDALETARQQHLERMEAHSAVFLQATLDAAAVLTPEQRRDLGDELVPLLGPPPPPHAGPPPHHRR